MQKLNIFIVWVLLISVVVGCEDKPKESTTKISVDNTSSLSPKVAPSSSPLPSVSDNTSQTLSLGKESSDRSKNFSRKLVTDISSGKSVITAALADSSQDEESQSSSEPSAASNAVVPAEVEKVLANAKNERAITEAINSAFKEAYTTTPSRSPINKGQFLTSDDVSELESNSATSQNQRINPGVRTSGSNSSGSAPLPTISGGFDFTDNPVVEATPTVLKLVGGQARGYTMLYMMHPRARQTVEKQVETLIRANIQEVFIGVLVDGTFGRDYDYLRSVLRRLAEGGRLITLALYLSNGSTMRIHDQSPISAGFNDIEPGEFRSLIRFSPSVRERFKNIAREAQPIFDYNKQINPRNTNIAFVMLEDNLDRESYRAMRELAKEVLGNNVRYMRNPCPGCYRGNDTDSLGDAVEIHGRNVMPDLKSGDGYSFDGNQFLYPNESGADINFTEATSLAVKAVNQGLAFFGLWRNGWQGLQNGVLVHTDSRSYHVPTDQESEYDIVLLRYGLSEIQ